MKNKLFTSGVWILVGISVGFWIIHATNPVTSSTEGDHSKPTGSAQSAQAPAGLRLLQSQPTPLAVKTLPAIAVLATISNNDGSGIIQISINNGPIETVRVGDMVTKELKLARVTPTEVQLNYAADDSIAKVLALPPLPKLQEPGLLNLRGTSEIRTPQSQKQK